MNETLQKIYAQFIEELKKDETVIAYQKAKEAYAANGVLMNKVVEYNAQAQALEVENARPEKDSLLIASITGRLKSLYDEIITDPTMVALNDTEKAVNDIITEVNYGLQCVIAPETIHEHDESCGGDCGHCGGCH